MAWIEIHEELSDHPKTRRAARSLNVDRDLLVGKLIRLWHWALKHASDGSLAGLENSDIAEAAAWSGDAEEFVDALTNAGRVGQSGFLETTDAGLVIHDWSDFAGRLVEKRRKDMERKRMALGRPSDGARTSTGRRSDSSHPAHVNRTVPNPTKPTPCKSPEGTIDHPGFDRFRAAYPSRCTRKNWEEAQKAWNKHRPDIGAVLNGLAWQDREYADWQKTDGAGKYVFIEAPTVWINQHNWEREKAVAIAAPKPPGRPRLNSLVDLAIVRKLTQFDRDAWGNAGPLEEERSANPAAWQAAGAEAEIRIRERKAKGLDLLGALS